MDTDCIRVVDFTGVKSANDASSAVINELHEAFTTLGFVIIKAHGLEGKVDDVFKVCKEFFAYPLEEKLKYLIRETSNTSGYSYLEREKTSPDHGDLKEYFHISNCPAQIWPEKFPSFQQTVKELYSSSFELAFTILGCMAMALKLDDPCFFTKNIKYITNLDKNKSSLRLLHYPALPDDYNIRPGQIRCGEHVDFGSITLLFPECVDGLQVKTRDGQFLPVPRVPGAVYVNVGGTMEYWTGHRYRAVPHKVVLPDDGQQRRGRLSIPLFVHVDVDTIITSIDDSSKLPSIPAGDIYKHYMDTVFYHKEY
ncbi:uncharacterized protein [Dysidea avara]|uniref:uncharacterized protein n=1 Tax=Dysidea avara TaxID=196820 RepID=UPI0033323316